MIIVAKGTTETFEIHPTKSGENPMTCPKCSHTRKKSKDKCMNWNSNANVGFCNHCDTSFHVFKEAKVNYKVPEWSNKTKLSDEWMKSLEVKRKITQKAIQLLGVSQSTEWMPQVNKEVPVMCFPYRRKGEIVNCKYRDSQKNFKLEKGAEKIPYNLDGIEKSKSVIIVEGEFDVLACVTAGIENVISVPNGASKNLDYFNSCFDEYLDGKQIVIAVDNDQAGKVLEDALLARFSPEDCLKVDWGKCKDANEYLLEYGGYELKLAIESAKEYPVEGIYRVEDFAHEIRDLYANGLQRGKLIDCKPVDGLISFETKRLWLVTGIPSHGKSEFVDFVVCKLNLLHGWKAAYFTPENFPLSYHYSKIADKFIGKQFNDHTPTEQNLGSSWINDNFFWLWPEDDFTIDTILSKAKYAVKKYGVKIIVLDPYNKLEHKYTGSETNYISSFLDKLTNFAKKHDVLFVLVAHPTKMKKMESGEYEVPGLYDISGSSNFYNKTDYGTTVYRITDEDGLSNSVEIHVNKVKFKHLGETGSCNLTYNYKNGRYEADSPKGFSGWDNSTWINFSE